MPLEPLLLEKKKPENLHTVHKVSLIVVSITLLILVIQIAFIASMSGEAVNTLKDVQEIVPEVKKGLELLQNICNSEEFSKYCV